MRVEIFRFRMIRHIRQINAVIDCQTVSQNLNNRGQLQENEFSASQMNSQIVFVNRIFSYQITIAEFIFGKTNQLMSTQILTSAVMQHNDTV